SRFLYPFMFMSICPQHLSITFPVGAGYSIQGGGIVSPCFGFAGAASHCPHILCLYFNFYWFWIIRLYRTAEDYKFIILRSFNAHIFITGKHKRTYVEAARERRYPIAVKPNKLPHASDENIFRNFWHYHSLGRIIHPFQVLIRPEKIGLPARI